MSVFIDTIIILLYYYHESQILNYAKFTAYNQIFGDIYCRHVYMTFCMSFYIYILHISTYIKYWCIFNIGIPGIFR